MGADLWGLWEWFPRAPPLTRPSPTAHRERRFRVYRDLWGRGLHLTAGGKFGGDFLVYPGEDVGRGGPYGAPWAFGGASVGLCGVFMDAWAFKGSMRSWGSSVGSLWVPSGSPLVFFGCLWVPVGTMGS